MAYYGFAMTKYYHIGSESEFRFVRNVRPKLGKYIISFTLYLNAAFLGLMSLVYSLVASYINIREIQN